MVDLIRMDLYRMRRSKVFWVCAILAFLFAFAVQPFSKLAVSLASMLGAESEGFPATYDIAKAIADPLPFFNAMLVMLSACSFFYADRENGYIKNIAGQVPSKGLTVVSKFIAILPHNLFFMLVGVCGCLIGSLLVSRLSAGSGTFDAVRIFFLKLLLLQAISSILLLTAAVYRSKPLGTVIAVLAGLGLLSLIYFAIDSGLDQVFKNKSFAIGDYMPDQLLGESDPDTLTAILSSVVTMGIFLPVSIAVFNKKEVK